MLVMNNLDDLKRWVNNRYTYLFSPEVIYSLDRLFPCAYFCPEMISGAADAICKRVDRPAWGQDWSDFLARLSI